MDEKARAGGGGPALDWAARVQRLEAEVDGLRRAMRSRAVIEQAKGFLSAALNCGLDEAFGHLDAVMAASADDIAGVEGVGQVIAKSVHEFFANERNREVIEKLRAAGLAGETPCAVISRATTPQQRTLRSTIAELHNSPKLAAPTLLVVGEVVRFADPITLAQGLSVPAISLGPSFVDALSPNFETADFATPDGANNDAANNEELRA